MLYIYASYTYLYSINVYIFRVIGEIGNEVSLNKNVRK